MSRGAGFISLVDANPVVLAVGDVQRSAVKQHGVRPRELATCGIAVRAVAALAVSYSRRNDPAAQVDFPDDVILTVCDVHGFAIVGDRESFGTGKPARTQ